MRNRNSFNSYFGVIGSLSFAFLLGCGSIGSHKKSRTSDHLGVVDPTAVSPFRVAFYNLENLFDTVDGPNDDAEFLPGSDNRWNSERYQSKLHNMSKVIDSIAPDILGVVEVENAFVLEDLRGFCGSMLDANEFRSGESAARNSYYEIVHRESPDLRGIDVALLFNRRKFYSTGVYMIPVTLADGITTRSIMRVHLIERLTGDSLAIFVNHWPSRRGGAASAASRLAAAAALMQNIQSTPNLPNNYLIMGDFNDDPEDRSITEGLNAGDVYHPIVNLAYVARSKDSTIGTLAWHDGWNMFDQIMVSRALYFANLHNHELVVAPNAESQVGPHINIYKKPWMLQHGGKYDGWPLRTFAGKKYMNGFSDHLPVYTDLVLVHRH